MGISKDLLRRYEFFKAHAGGIVGHSAECALGLARAEEWLQGHIDAGRLETFWEHDQDADRGPRDWGWSEKEIKRWEETEHEVAFCRIEDANGNVLASLSGIWDADRTYARIVETELALEIMGRWDGEVLDAGEVGDVAEIEETLA